MLFKRKYSIVFYDETDEVFMYQFDNVIDILKFQKKPITNNNKRAIIANIYRGMHSTDHKVTFLTGDIMRIYLIDVEEEEQQ